MRLSVTWDRLCRMWWKEGSSNGSVLWTKDQEQGDQFQDGDRMEVGGRSVLMEKKNRRLAESKLKQSITD